MLQYIFLHIKLQALAYNQAILLSSILIIGNQNYRLMSHLLRKNLTEIIDCQFVICLKI